MTLPAEPAPLRRPSAQHRLEPASLRRISYRENADTTTAQGKLMFGGIASLAELERALIAPKEAAIRRDLLAGRRRRDRRFWNASAATLTLESRA
jgi:DNA invertase Pin-like site-specific DNA recombinase